MTTQIITLLIGTVVTVFALISYFNFSKLLKAGVKAEGVIFDFKSSESGSNSLLKYPIVRFLTTDDEWKTYPSTTSAFPGFFKKGDKISIYYNPKNPEEFVINSSNSYMVPIFIGFIGLIIMASSFFL